MNRRKLYFSPYCPARRETPPRRPWGFEATGRIYAHAQPHVYPHTYPYFAYTCVKPLKVTYHEDHAKHDGLNISITDTI